jgi:DNA-binding FadR family transcriptional regulator
MAKRRTLSRFSSIPSPGSCGTAIWPSTGISGSVRLSVLFPAERLNLVKEEHSVVLKAIVKKDAEAARAAMHAHIDSYRRRLIHGTKIQDVNPPSI